MTNTQPAQRPDENPEAGGRADLIGAAGEAAGEDPTHLARGRGSAALGDKDARTSEDDSHPAQPPAP